MKTTRPELGFERLLVALERDLLDATNEEILTVVNELGMKPDMKGSIALLGVTFAVQLKDQDNNSGRQTKKATRAVGATRPRRRRKGDAPSST
ncbi:MAG: hypothetical protein ACJ8R9_30205 [Steroidobacteraceae bacterium]